MSEAENISTQSGGQRGAVDLSEWAKITIERWNLRIGRIGQKAQVTPQSLLNSFRTHVEKDANGNHAKIVFTFHFYGYFWDAGVGRGSREGKRTKKRHAWYNKIYWREVQTLARLMAEQYGEESQYIIKSIETINFKK